MEIILEILKYTLPSLIVFLASYFIIKSFMENEQKKRIMELRSSNQKLITPIRLQAYERMTLLLERISPESLIMRLQHPKMSAKQLQSDMLSAIRSEFDHNLSQQIYISSGAWEVVKNTRENIVKIINSAGDRVKPESTALDYSKIVFEMLMTLEKKPTSVALEFLKAEVKQFM